MKQAVMTVEKANAYIETHKTQVNHTYKPTHHFSAEVGWINDPNGFVFFRGEYHLFYQFHPYSSQWGPMHWGHAKSKDMIHWEHLPVALAPDQPYDKDGCFSGSAIVKDDVLWLMYTGVIVEDGNVRQVQNMARSTDGVHFEKVQENPVATGDLLPVEVSKKDFRDPKLFEHDGRYYSVVASQHEDQVGCLVLLGSEDLVHWEFESIFLKGEPHQGIVFECPDYFVVDGVECLIVSPIHYQREGDSFFNVDSSIVMTGCVDWNRKVFVPETVSELDHGQDFYAPQTLEDNRGRRIMIAWMQMWGRTIHSHELGHHWAGAMTLPRELCVVNGRIHQQLPEEVKTAIPLTVSLPATLANAGRLSIPVDGTVTYRVGDDEDYLLFGYDASTHQVFVDRSHLRLAIVGEEAWDTARRYVTIEAQSLEVIFDRHSIEVFVNKGEAALSATFYLTVPYQVATVE